MKTIPKLISIIIGIMIVGCSTPDTALEQALIVSEENRGELESVLDHYRNPSDSLKYEAARHLIIEMTREKGISYHSPEYESFTSLVYDSLEETQFHQSKDTMTNKWIRSVGFDGIWNHFSREAGPLSSFEFDHTYDIRSIRADFLIENIDYAFKAWDLPWARNYSFEVFKETFFLTAMVMRFFTHGANIIGSTSVRSEIR